MADEEDVIPEVELTQWQVGRVLSQEDVAMLQLVLEDMSRERDEFIDHFGKAREVVAMEMGGAEFVEVLRLKDEQEIAEMTQRVMAKFYAKQRNQKRSAN